MAPRCLDRYQTGVPVRAQKGVDALRILGKDGAGGIQELTPGGEERPQTREHAGLLLGHARDVRWPAQDFDIGMAAYDPGPRAGGVDEDAVEKMAVSEGAGILPRSGSRFFEKMRRAISILRQIKLALYLP